MLVLSKHNTISQKELQSITNLSIRTIKYSLTYLVKNNFVEEIYFIGDMRRKLKRLS